VAAVVENDVVWDTTQLTDAERLAGAKFVPKRVSQCPCTFDPANVEVVSWTPRAFLYKNFLTEEEADHLIASGYAQGIRPSKVASGEGEVPSDARTSSGVFLYPDGSGVFECVEQRLAEWSQLHPLHGELFYFLEYQVGQQYKPHWDYFDPRMPGMKEYVKGSVGGQRMATALLYLHTPEKGGETIFPRANAMVPARRRDALLFWDQTPDRVLDELSMHGGSPVVKGVKVCLTKWMTEGPGGHIRSFVDPVAKQYAERRKR